MTPERWVLLGDFAASLPVVVIAGSYLASRGLGPWLVAVPPGAVLAAAWTYREERGALPPRIERIRENPFALAVAVFVGAVVLVPPPFVWPGMAVWYATAFVGFGLGLAGYRFVYGVLRPIPERRLALAREEDA